MIAARDLDRSEVESLLADPDAPFSRPQTVMLKNSRTSTVAETTMLVGGQPARVVYKRFNRKKWIDPWLNLVRPSCAWRSWQAGQHLASRGIPTPRNLAFLARKRSARSCPFSWFLPHETYLVTIKQDNVMTLAEYVRKVLPTLDQPALRDRGRRLNLALAHLIRALHERSLSHRDLKATNILVHLDCLETSEFLSLIDLVGVRLMNPVPQRRRIQNLARLSISLASAVGRTRTESLRFLLRLSSLGVVAAFGLEERLEEHGTSRHGEAGTKPTARAAAFLNPTPWEPEHDPANLGPTDRQDSPALAGLAAPGVLLVRAADRLRDLGKSRPGPCTDEVPGQDRSVPGLFQHSDPRRFTGDSLPALAGNRLDQPAQLPLAT